MVLDASVKTQTYVEDCEVCCHPIQITYAIEEGEVANFSVSVLE